MTEFVVDCSVAMAWCFPDEANAYADAALDALKNGQAHVPALWPIEVSNVLVVAERRGRISASEADDFVRLVQGLPIVVERDTPDRAFTEILLLARQHRLTSYDAAYLELALRSSLPLCTLDDDLKTAATALGVREFSA